MTCCGQKNTSNLSIPAIGCNCETCAGSCPTVDPSNCTTILNRNLNPLIYSTQTWNVPLCFGSVTVFFPPETRFMVGGYIWNPTYGYFQITNYNRVTGQTTLTNNCVFPIAAYGTKIPACTKFLIVANPLPAGGIPGVFLISDFTAPGLGSCVTVNLTTNFGLTAGMIIGIGQQASYVINEVIDDGSSIVICNQGAGFTAGTIITAANSSGNFIFPISVRSFILANRVEVSSPFTTYGVAPVIISTVDIPVTNPFSNASILIKGFISGYVEGEYNPRIASPEEATLNLKVELVDTVNPAYLTSMESDNILLFDAAGTPFFQFSKVLSKSFMMIVPASGAENIKAKFTITMTPKSGTDPVILRYYLANQANVSVTYIGVEI